MGLGRWSTRKPSIQLSRMATREQPSSKSEQKTVRMRRPSNRKLHSKCSSLSPSRQRRAARLRIAKSFMMMCRRSCSRVRRSLPCPRTWKILIASSVVEPSNANVHSLHSSPFLSGHLQPYASRPRSDASDRTPPPSSPAAPECTS